MAVPRRGSQGISAIEEGLDACSADHVVQGQPADIMRGPEHLAVAVAGFEVRVVVFLVGHEADRVDEAQGVVEVLEREVLDDRLAVRGDLPARQGRQVAVDRGAIESMLGALAGRAVLAGEGGKGAGKGTLGLIR
jgi:hypothetical protein